MKLTVKKGRTSLLVKIFIQDSSQTDGRGLTGLTSGSSGLVCYRARDDDGNAGATQITLSGGTKGTWSSGGFVEKDSTNMPGVYELGIPDNAIASGSETAVIMLKGATNMAPVVMEIQLVAYDPQDSVRQGMTALPNAAAAASGGLLVLGTNATAISFTGGMTISNASGDALVLSSSGSNGHGLNTSGNGSGDGIHAVGGATGNGANLLGGATSGDGLVAAAQTSGNGLTATGVGTTKHGINATGGSTSSDGIHATGGGTGDGIKATGGATGNALELVGGGTSGDGLKVTTTSGHGMNIVATGTAKDGIHTVGAAAATTNAAGHGISATGGAATTSAGGTSGIGIKALGGAGAASTNGASEGITATGGGTTTVSGADGIKTTGTGNLHGLELAGAGSGDGLKSSGGATGVGIEAVGGATSGDGIKSTVTSGKTIGDAAVDAILDRTVGDTYSMRKLLLGYGAVLLGKASGLSGTTATYRAADDSVDRVVATVDSNGNRSAVTLTLS